MESFTGVAILALFATFVIKIVDIFKTIFMETDVKSIIKMLVWTLLAFGLGCLIAFAGPVDMFKMLGFEFEAAWAAKLLTGLAIGSGGAFIYDLLDGKFM